MRAVLDHDRGFEGGVAVRTDRDDAVVSEQTRVVVLAERIGGEPSERLRSRDLRSGVGDEVMGGGMGSHRLANVLAFGSRLSVVGHGRYVRAAAAKN
jgi:hypothetical protein